MTYKLPALMLLVLITLSGAAQTASPAPVGVPMHTADANESRLDTMSRLLVETQRQLEETQRQLNELRTELEGIRSHEAAVQAVPKAVAEPAIAEQVVRQQEEQEVLQAEVKQHDQTKLESVSKYPVRVYGLLLFNAYSNAGVVDNADLASIAAARTPGESHGSVGATFRQTLLGIRAKGPMLFGARSSADLSADFFGDLNYSYYGTPNGTVRLRTGDIRLAWGGSAGTESSRNELHLGVSAPLISPLSPTSFATVAEPALAWAGNLWMWAPEIQVQHTIPLSTRLTHSLQLEGGLWDPPVVGQTGASTSHVLSAGELSRRPGLMGRASLHGGTQDHPFSLGVGGYSNRETLYEGQSIQMWAVTSDWQIPITHHFELSGEIYRGRGLAGLGGGAYKDILTGIDRTTGQSRTLGLNAVGGWAQLKTHLFQGGEANFIFGQDGGFASDFRQLDLSSNAYTLEQSARNQMMVANMIYRPRSYLIVSPEYRRILSWKTYDPRATANIFTVTLGYQF